MYIEAFPTSKVPRKAIRIKNKNYSKSALLIPTVLTNAFYSINVFLFCWNGQEYLYTNTLYIDYTKPIDPNTKYSSFGRLEIILDTL